MPSVRDGSTPVMNVLPWLLDWPPSRGTIAVFVVLTAFSVGTLVLFGGVTDEISVLGDVTVRIPAERTRVDARAERLTLAVSLGHTAERTTQTLTRTGDVTADVFWVIEDDETLSVNETARLEVSVESAESTLANRTTAVPVENGTRTYDC